MAEIFLKLGELFKYLGATPDSRCCVEGEQVLNARHLILCGKKNSEQSDNIHVIGLCLQTSALQSKPHEIEGTFSVENDVVRVKTMKCSCKAGLSGTCKHVSAMLLYCTRLYHIQNTRGESTCPVNCRDTSITFYFISFCFCCSVCFRTDIRLLETLSSTDVECYWGKKKLNSKEKYTALPISDYSCLEMFIKRRKIVHVLSNEDADSCADELLDILPECSMKKHCLGRRSGTYTTAIPGKSNNSNILQDQGTLDIDKLLEHFDLSLFLLNLAEQLSLKKFNLQECCLHKWQQISKCDIKNAISSMQKSEEWFKCRQFRITDEQWRKKTMNCFFPKPFSNKYVRHGNENEANALVAYQVGTANSVLNSLGFIICKRFPWLGFSPDAVVVENGSPIKLVEIKCPYSGRTEDATSFTSCEFLVNLDGTTQLKKKHAYYGQIQLGLAILNLKVCDFIVYSSSCNTFLKLEIPFDPVFAKKLILTISEKYFSKMLHFLCNDN